MTTRVVAVLVAGGNSGLADALVAAMLEDVADLAAAMPHVEPVLAVAEGQRDLADAVRWPGMAVVPVDDANDAAAALDALQAAGADEAALVVADAPDLPPLLLGKLFSAMTGAEAAACPADGGGLVALASKIPVPSWLRSAGVGLDDPGALDRLRAAAPRRAFAVGPGWHRVRTTADLDRLDEGLEGWDNTRVYLAAQL